jgi:FtsZ-interacting cell division protein ZipA
MKLFFENILAAKHNFDENLIQFLIIAAIVVFGILKTIAGAIKSAWQQQNFDKNYKPANNGKASKYIDSPDDFKTMEQLRDEKIAQIRTTFGIPSPKPPLMQPEEFGEHQDEEEIYVAPVPPPVPQKKYIKKPQPRGVSSSPRTDAYFNEMLKDVGIYPTISEPEMAPLSKHYEQPQRPAAKHKQPSTPSKPQMPASVNAVFSSADDLRKAVLYQEILGKPVSLRD